uniref:Uncharacterized protein n=1 Tax=Nomascus leucogenys TaxID=61853 RepID=A0A2I3HZN6_NOMLE
MAKCSLAVFLWPQLCSYRLPTPWAAGLAARLNPEVFPCCGWCFQAEWVGAHRGQPFLPCPCLTLRAFGGVSTSADKGYSLQGWVLSLFSAGPRWQLLASGLPSASLWDLCLPGISCLASAGGSSLWGPSLPPALSSSPEAAALPSWAQEAPCRHMMGRGCPHPPPRGCSPVSGHVSPGLSPGFTQMWAGKMKNCGPTGLNPVGGGIFIQEFGLVCPQDGSRDVPSTLVMLMSFSLL